MEEVAYGVPQNLDSLLINMHFWDMFFIAEKHDSTSYISSYSFYSGGKTSDNAMFKLGKLSKKSFSEKSYPDKYQKHDSASYIGSYSFYSGGETTDNAMFKLGKLSKKIFSEKSNSDKYQLLISAMNVQNLKIKNS